ncbi:hypothetical protein MTsPCn5_20730 [Croceitalea sp. MTPC5]|uniref:NAD-dependent epimerase/dehydratase family protein n=1 Tax=Croceitalea sp. MTPC5 TaxID=3056565 RepID=UPI002B3B9DE5|nr:hypothetical protein MTsPCn5_20730 [Croceitalea sp. MTPC5]
METKGKTAIILGATGLVGSVLLQCLLHDGRYQKIILFSRTSVGIQDSKLDEVLCDVLALEAQLDKFWADEVFCCIGTTKAKTPDKVLYKKIDYGIPVAAAKLCSLNQIHTFIVVSALGADASSAIFYNRIKGEMERMVQQFNIPKIHMVQPSIIGGDRNEQRPGEFFFKKLMSFFGFLLVGPFKKYRVIHPDSIAKAMVWLANNTYTNQRIASDTLKELAVHGTS